MTQDAFKAWWYNEGSQTPYTHHDCEEHTMRMCEIAWNKAQLAQPEQEPVANYCKECLTYNGHHEGCSHYTHPPQRTWVGLTDEEIKALASWWPSYDQIPALMVLAKDIQNSLKEKNT